MELYSYVVARDYGFAPNPFMNVCTLATCKPKIRANAQVGDWVVGTGTASRKRSGRIVFAMRVSETMTFNSYWNDPRFQEKKPYLLGSKKQAFGDNIYCKPLGKPWHQMNSHHSYADGSINVANVANDTQANRVLIGEEFVYWGGSGAAVLHWSPTFRALIKHKRKSDPTVDEAQDSGRAIVIEEETLCIYFLASEAAQFL